MSNIRKNNEHVDAWLIVARIFLLCMIAGWMYVIFSFSAQNVTDSTAASDKAIAILSRIIELVTGKDVGFKLATDYHSYVEFGVRKLAHMFIYFVLSITNMLFLFTYKKCPMLLRIFLSVLVCFLYACTDEFHQFFVDGRGASFRDVLIDTSGAVMGIFIALMIYCVLYTIYHIYSNK